MDVTEVVRADHRRIESLLRTEVITEIARELTAHVSAEEALLDPEVKAELPGGDDIVLRGVAEHQAMREALAKLEAQHDDELETASRLHELAALVHSHVEDEEANVLPALASRLSPERLDELASRFQRAKRMAPTHAHPLAGPAEDGGGKVVNLAAGITDRVKDAVTRVTRVRAR